MKINRLQKTQSQASGIWNYVNTKVKDFYIENESDIENLIIKTTPENILTLSQSNTFGNLEKEISARWILRFLMDRDNSFLPINQKEFQDYYVANLGKKEEFLFNDLEYGNPQSNIEPRIKIKNGTIYLSQAFIIFCSINDDSLFLEY